MLTDWTQAPVAPKLAGALSLVHRMTKEPNTIDDPFVSALRERGLSDDDIESAATVAFRYALINRAADVFAFPIPTPDERAKLARILARMSRMIRVQPPVPRFVRGPDGVWRPSDADAARTQLLTVPGATSTELRKACEAFAARYFDANRPDLPLPEQVSRFVGRVAAFPASVDDAAVESLRSAGYTDEAIFEITMAAAFGVACAGVEPLAARLAE